MNKYIQLCCLCYICFIAFILIDMSNANGNTHHLQRRYISLRNMSHFFLRFNFKANMVPWNQIFAQALGFRMNWDDPPDTFHPYRNHFIHRRAIYSHIETLLDKNGLNGFQCVRRAICEMETIHEPRNIYHKLLKMVFRYSILGMLQKCCTRKDSNHHQQLNGTTILLKSASLPYHRASSPYLIYRYLQIHNN